MRSRAEGRARGELALRAAALAVVVVALVRALTAARAGDAATVHVRADGGLEPVVRDSLAAHARAGARVTWSGTVAAVAATSEPVRDPSRRTRLVAVGDGPLHLADSLGPVDSLPEPSGALTTAALAGVVRAAGGGDVRTEARTVARPGTSPGRVLLLGRAGWEAKFALAALEEAGWAVDARLRLSDTLFVTQGDRGPPLTGRHAAVVVLDPAVVTAAAVAGSGGDAAALARYVRAGGGLVLSGDGATALAALAPARAGAERAGERDAFERGEPRHALPFRPLEAPRADAAVLDRRDGVVAVAARRVGAGRVVQSGYGETWRWRMQAERDGPEAHRAFWNDLVAAAAAGRDATPAASGALDEAPRAALVQRLGDPAPPAPASSPPPRPLSPLFGALALLLLLAEWASRRARGAA